MAFSHHHHHLHCSSSATCCCCSCTAAGKNPPPAAASDPLLQTLAAQLLRFQTQQQLLLLQQVQQPPCQNHHHDLHPASSYHRKNHRHQEEEEEREPQSTGIHALIQRVAALESSLQGLSPPPSKSPLRPPPASPSRVSVLRNSAARVIQSHFRLFLVRRSQTLRALKRLSSVRSRVSSIKSSPMIADPRSVCRQAADLLQHLDSIQSGDPMVCQEKISIGREIAAILEALERIPRVPTQSQWKPRKGGVSEERVDNGVSCDGSWRTSSEDDEVEEEDDGNRGNDGGRLLGSTSARGLGLDAPLPIKMETRRGC